MVRPLARGHTASRCRTSFIPGLWAPKPLSFQTVGCGEGVGLGRSLDLALGTCQVPGLTPGQAQ